MGWTSKSHSEIPAPTLDRMSQGQKMNTNQGNRHDRKVFVKVRASVGNFMS